MRAAAILLDLRQRFVLASESDQDAQAIVAFVTLDPSKETAHDKIVSRNEVVLVSCGPASDVAHGVQVRVQPSWPGFPFEKQSEDVWLSA